MTIILLGGPPLTREDVISVAREGVPVALDPAARERMRSSRSVVERYADSTRPVYGVTTGFGALSDQWVPRDQRLRLQLNLIRSHSSAVGTPLPRPLVRAMMVLRAQGLARGLSGVRPEVVEALVAWLNAGATPVVPGTGSVGASGDLAPLAHLTLALLGEGTAEDREGHARPAHEVLRENGLPSLTLQEKEGISLVNGTALMVGELAFLVHDGHRLLRAAEFASAMSFDALRGNLDSLDPRVHEARGLPAAEEEARRFRALLRGSTLARSGEDPAGQDPYVLRCLPQVLGATRQGLAWADELLAREINAVSDNPLVLDGAILSGGDFHGQPLALALDTLALALSYVGTFSERRVARLVDAKLSRGLPAFLSADAGAASGYMIPPYVAAALVSENQSLVHPASATSLPTSANQEDFNSQGATAGAKGRRLLRNLFRGVSVELLLAAQALELRRPLTGGAGSVAALAAVRRRAPPLTEDRPPAPDLERIFQDLTDGPLLEEMEAGLAGRGPGT
jgi:histidine ammonia-lyase